MPILLVIECVYFLSFFFILFSNSPLFLSFDYSAFFPIRSGVDDIAMSMYFFSSSFPLNLFFFIYPVLSSRDYTWSFDRECLFTYLFLLTFPLDSVG